MDADIITILNPTNVPMTKRIYRSSQPHGLNNKVLGLLWNSKPNGDVMLLRIRDQLSQRFHLAGISWHQKSIQATPADMATIEKLANVSNLVINAIGE